MRKWILGLALVLGLGLVGFTAEYITLTAWGSGSPVDATRCNNLIAAASYLESELKAEGAPVAKVEPTCQYTHVEDWGAYTQRFILAFKAGEAPDIFACGHENIGWLAEGGYIVPLDEYVEKYWDEYNLGNIFGSLWEAVKYKGHIYGFPQDTEARPVYFRKDILRKLGWSEDEINALPEKVKKGEFTLDDMIALAKEAVDKGLVEYGIYHRPSPGGYFAMIYLDYGGTLQDPETGKLVLDKAAMLKTLQFHYKLVQEGVTPAAMTQTSWRSIHKAFVEGKILFWFGGTWHWAEWQRVAYHSELGALPESYEWENMGFMLVPAAEKGGKPITLSHPFVYVITSAAKDPELAFRLVALTSKPELVAKHALGSAHLSILKENAPEYSAWKFGSAVTYMLDYTTSIPNHPKWSVYKTALYQAIQAVETGAMTPDKALEWITDKLTRELGDELIVKG
ncbi:extracellular solute-binding protein [Candidatus Bipolaricaulota bacterium]|nr:extracellular solute-binding protein [Candidatus Bipolaricaulota bacterium]